MAPGAPHTSAKPVARFLCRTRQPRWFGECQARRSTPESSTRSVPCQRSATRLSAGSRLAGLRAQPCALAFEVEDRRGTRAYSQMSAAKTVTKPDVEDLKDPAYLKIRDAI